MVSPAPPAVPSKGIALRLFVSFWAFYALHFATNIEREIYLALTLGDRFSVDVSEYLGLHSDLFAIPGRGAFIDNNPGASIVGAMPYALARPIIDRIVAGTMRARAATPGAGPREYATPHEIDRAFYRKAWARGLDVKLGLAAGVMQAFAMAPLSAASVVVMFLLLQSRVQSPRTAAALAALYGVATPIFYRTAQLNHNLLVAHCALFAFALLWRPWDPRPDARPAYLAAGLLAGWALVCDYSGLVVIAFIGVYASLTWTARPGARGGDLAQLAGGVALSASVLLGYQWLCFGHPLHPAQYYMPATHFSARGHVGVTWPALDLIRETAFGLRFGLFTSAPLLLLALYPPAWLGARTRLVGGREALALAFFCVVLFLFCGAIQYGRLQYITGVRYVVPAAPFLFVIAAGVLLRLRPAAAVALGIITAYWSWCLAMVRDVRLGVGIPEAAWQVTTGGPRLPWLTTFERMGYVEPGLAPLVLALFALALVVLWRRAFAPPPRSRTIG